MLKPFAFGLAAAFMFATPTIAADFGDYEVHRWCPNHTSAQTLVGLMGTDQLRPEVERRYEDAVATFLSSYPTTTPRFTWANQAKNACAKAIGYLDYPLRRRPTVEILQKCDCFYDRMSAYAH